MKLPVTLLEAGPEMAEQVAMLVRQLLLEQQPEAAEQINRMELFEVAEQLLGAGDLRALVAFQGVTPVGVITLHQGAALYAGGRFGEISECYVVPELRGQGIGQRLLERAAALALQAGWRRLEVVAAQPPLEFFARAGFSDSGSRLSRVLISEA